MSHSSFGRIWRATRGTVKHWKFYYKSKAKNISFCVPLHTVSFHRQMFSISFLIQWYNFFLTLWYNFTYIFTKNVKCLARVEIRRFDLLIHWGDLVTLHAFPENPKVQVRLWLFPSHCLMKNCTMPISVGLASRSHGQWLTKCPKPFFLLIWSIPFWSIRTHFFKCHNFHEEEWERPPQNYLVFWWSQGRGQCSDCLCELFFSPKLLLWY